LKRKRLASVLLIAGLTVAILAALLFLMLESPRTVYAVKAESGDFPVEVAGFGKAGPRRTTASFGQAGVVAEVLVRAGDEVEKGQLLARLDDAAIRQRLQAAESRLRLGRLDAQRSEERLRAQIVSLEDSLAQARADLQVREKLLAAGAASAAEVDRARQRVALLEAQLEAARRTLEAELVRQRARIDLLQADVAAAGTALARTRLLAPVAGVVELVTLEPGRSADGVVVIRQPGPATLAARFSLADGSRLRSGQRARLEFETWPPVEVETTVARVLPRQPGTGWIEAQFEGVAGAPDVTGQFDAWVTVEVLPGAVFVPRLALIEEEGSAYVWVVRYRRARKVEVTPLARNENYVAIAGLRAGATVLSRPPSDLKEGERLRLIEDPGD